MKYPLVVQTPNPLLVNLLKRKRRETLNNRKKYGRYIEQAEELVEKIHRQHHPDLCRKIYLLKAEIAVVTKGIPSTEAIYQNIVDTDSVQSATASSFLLKKAYRMASSIAHPDRGGSHEDFVAIKNAYTAGNLKSLNEYVIARNLAFFDQVQYWMSESQSPLNEFEKFRSSTGYEISRLYSQGRIEDAKKLSELTLNTIVKLLHSELHSLQEEQYNAIRKKSSEESSSSLEEDCYENSNKES